MTISEKACWNNLRVQHRLEQRSTEVPRHHSEHDYNHDRDPQFHPERPLRIRFLPQLGSEVLENMAMSDLYLFIILPLYVPMLTSVTGGKYESLVVGFFHDERDSCHCSNVVFQAALWIISKSMSAQNNIISTQRIASLPNENISHISASQYSLES